MEDFLSKLYFLDKHRTNEQQFIGVGNQRFTNVHFYWFNGLPLGGLASHSCTEYHWGSLIAFYRAVHKAQVFNWQKGFPLTSGPGAKRDTLVLNEICR